MFRILIALLVAGTLGAQTQAPENKDPLGRTTPQEAIVHFLEACHSRDYGKALLYLDLRKMPAAQRAQEGPKLAGQLEDLLDDTAFEITTLSRAPEGDQADGLAPGLERLATFKVQGKTLEMHLERVELTPGVRVWLVSPDSIAMIPQAHQLVEETPFEKTLPQPLVTFEILDTPVWRWIALILIGAALWAAAGVLTRALTGAVQRFKAVPAFWRPLRVLVTAAGLRAAMEFAPPPRFRARSSNVRLR